MVVAPVSMQQNGPQINHFPIPKPTESLEDCQASFDKNFEEPVDMVQRVGALDKNCWGLQQDLSQVPMMQMSLSKYIDELLEAEAAAEDLHLDQQSLIGNTNYADILRINGNKIT